MFFTLDEKNNFLSLFATIIFQRHILKNLWYATIKMNKIFMQIVNI